MSTHELLLLICKLFFKIKKKKKETALPRFKHLNGTGVFVSRKQGKTYHHNYLASTPFPG